MAKTGRVWATVEPELEEKLREIAHEEWRTVSSVVGQAIAEYVDRHDLGALAFDPSDSEAVRAHKLRLQARVKPD